MRKKFWKDVIHKRNKKYFLHERNESNENYVCTQNSRGKVPYPKHQRLKTHTQDNYEEANLKVTVT